MMNTDLHATRTLLIVDDQAPVRDTLRFILTRAGFHVVTAESGATALVAAETQSIDAALIDVNMPAMDGFETSCRLHTLAEETGRPLRMWLMTGAANALMDQKAAECGTFGLLRKPFDLPGLIETLDNGFSEPLRRPEQHAEVVAAAVSAIESGHYPSWNSLHQMDPGR